MDYLAAKGVSADYLDSWKGTQAAFLEGIVKVQV